MNKILSYILCYFLIQAIMTQTQQDNECTDVVHDNLYTCAQQASWGKCDAAWMIQGSFCQKTCNRCTDSCVDVAPDNRYSCDQQASWGQCDTAWMIQGNFCQKTCHRCSETCIDKQPEGDFTCEQQAAWGKCDQPWMQGFCDKSCGRCQGLDCSLAASLECDKIALMEFKGRMSQQAQALLTSWANDNPCSGWKGIVCRMVVLDDGSRGLRVNRIRLGEFNWEQQFNLWTSEDNPNYVPNMNADFPKIVPQNMLYLEELSLWNSGVKGLSLPLELSQLEDIQVIALGNNNFGGSLPKEFSTWGDVEVVEFEGMGLAGNLPSEFSAWSQLRAFNTRFNQLTGSIPSEYSLWVSGSRPISMQGFFVEQDKQICTSEDLVSEFTKRASLATDITQINVCQAK